MGRPLANYDDYLDRIKLYMEACTLDLEYRPVDGEGMLVRRRRKIVIDPDLPESTEIATILHELGHYLDDTLYHEDTMHITNAAYDAYYSDTATRDQCELVVECETRAWTYAVTVAKKLRIPLGKWFYSERQSALVGYLEGSTT